MLADWPLASLSGDNTGLLPTHAMILRHNFTPPNNTRLTHLCGPTDAHLRQIELLDHALGMSRKCVHGVRRRTAPHGPSFGVKVSR